ncbi:hypothetical protein DAPPUDRAFT_262404 [Daphnia pulex]|uniref:Uncharacterized protein n=1 Tax=Daphnia pulex TaxID=6669 RepID=E9HMX8_DAPPU|nr:hypothetical protein DAPPUDRAFT_262404 [Daphnia pulex]|eukprot:EFX66913.1 hypothetical protein DAPPUDRAFT_262404 [Daphnia pulex]
MEVLKSRVVKFSDSSKARLVQHRKIIEKKARIDKIIDHLNGNDDGVIVTQPDLASVPLI